jgi:hypothetical protein
MSAWKITPSEALQYRKQRLQTESDRLSQRLEENFVYLQQNLAPLLGDSAFTFVVSKTPPFVQDLFDRPQTGSFADRLAASNLSAIAEGALDILPFFLKGPKGFVAQLILGFVKRIFFRK